MKNRKFLSILCAFVMMLALSITLISTNEVYAADNTTYFGTTLASTDAGSASITTSLSNGLEVTFKKASSASSANYKHTLYMADFSISFKYSNANFEETWFKFTDADNDTKWVKVYLKQQDNKISYKLEDNLKNKTDYVDTGLATSKLSEGLVLSYDGETKAFTLGSVALTSTDISTLSFYKNMADLSFGVTGVNGEGEDAVILIDSINTQSLKTTDNKITDRKAPVIISKVEGVDAPVTSSASIAVNAAAEAEYIFPYYCLDVLGTGWAVSVDDGAKVVGKTKHSMGAENSTAKIQIFAKESDEDAVVTLNVTAVKDTKAVEIKDMDGLLSFITEGDNDLADAISAGHLVAPTEGNTFEFPRIDRDTYNDYVQKDGETIDTFDSVTIKVGYKAPNSNGNYIFASSYSVKINKTGEWRFVYQFIDGSGNKTLSDSFTVRVFDEDAPTIKVDESVEIVVDEAYTIPSATITDNASGVDSRYTKWTLYEVDGSTRTEIKNLVYGEEGYDESALKDGVLTPTEVGKKYVVVYQAQDVAGNVADEAEMSIEVVDATPDYVENPFNDFVRTALIVVACLAGVGIIILIFVKPRARTLK